MVSESDRSIPKRDRRADLNERLRAALLEGAEEDSRRRLGRGLTQDELERVLLANPGDLRSLDAAP